MPYTTAQICLNGHCISSAVDMYPEEAQPFCEKCGAKTITACPKCGAPIRGVYCEKNCGFIPELDKAPAYCLQCGSPFPWTQSALDIAVALIEEDDSLSGIERKQMIETLPDVISETPKTKLAVIRLKKVLSVVSSFTADGLRQFAIEFGCELVKKQLGL
jgi:hypothetical protein|nr:MAG TPA: putative cytoplasmic protein [Caudoviricetes sp.]